MTFSVSYDGTAKFISIAVCAGLVLLSAAFTNVWTVALLLMILGVAWAYSPRGYVVSDTSIRVERPIGPVAVPLAGLREARVAMREDLRFAIRLFGSGGLFGYYGLFWTKRLGKASWYVTDRRKAVVVETAAKTAVFSPDDVSGFLAAIRAAGPVPEAGIPAPLREERTYWIRAVLGAVVIGFVILSFYYSPGLPACSLTRDTLAIRDRFYPVTLGAHDVDIAGIRVVDLREEAGWRPTVRTGGFGNLRYHSGWFRVANGKKVRLYRERGHRLVLLPGKGDAAPVLLEAKDPEDFVRQARREWSSGG